MRWTTNELRATFERTLRTVTEAGLCEPTPVPEIDDELREFLRTRYEASRSLLGKLTKSRNGEVRGITPLEYEHMVTSLQAGYREAEVCCGLKHEVIAAAFRTAVAVRERLGLGFENPYPAGSGDWLEFFLGRSEVLWDVLRRVNQAYSDCEVVDWDLL